VPDIMVTSTPSTNSPEAGSTLNFVPAPMGEKQ
jgi:hypothetical protein